MNNQVLISVIVPIYNVEKYLHQCINSLLNQTYSNLEIILVNDGSPDKSGEICDEYAKCDNRIKVIHKENGGLSDARNAGIDAAKGKYIGFVDSDDFLHPQFYDFLINSIADADLIFCDLFKFWDEDVITPLSLSLSNYNTIDLDKYFLIENIASYRSPLVIVAWNKLYKRELWTEIRYPFGKIHEDEHVIHHVLDKANSIKFLDIPLYYYRQHDASIMSNYSMRNIRDIICAFQDREEFYINKNMDDSAKAMYNSYHSILLRPAYSFKNETLLNKSFKEIIVDKRLRRKLKIQLITKKINESFYYKIMNVYRKYK